MNKFELELMRRSPLAGCVLELSDHVFDPALLARIYDPFRGRCYEDVLSFDSFLVLMRDALVRYGGSAHQLFVELENDNAHPVDESNFYRKLSRMPVPVSRALLREGSQRLRELMPGPAVVLPACFDHFEVVIGDGKKIKDAAKRLAPTRGFSGSLIGAKALVGIDARTGLALAMSDSLDGLTNDVPLVPELMQQLIQVIDRPILSVWDRQFGEPKTMKMFIVRPGDAFLTRVKQTLTFTAESCVETIDSQGRKVIDETGFCGHGKTKMRVRRVSLIRPGEEDVIVVTNLTDAKLYSADDLLALYAKRWGIEQIFQQVTETFSLQHLIGSAPKAVLLQFSFCLLLYNMMQVIKAYVAQDGGVLITLISMHYLFDHTRRQLQAWAYHTSSDWPRSIRTAQTMRQRLAQLLEGIWNPKRFTKAADKKPRGKPKPITYLKGGHSSVQRLLEGRANVVAIS
jgi:hypothetical protein